MVVETPSRAYSFIIVVVVVVVVVVVQCRGCGRRKEHCGDGRRWREEADDLRKDSNSNSKNDDDDGSSSTSVRWVKRPISTVSDDNNAMGRSHPPMIIANERAVSLSSSFAACSF